MSSPASTLPLLDLQPDTASFRDEVLAGLQSTPKTISSKFLYDERGSKLFEAICELDEYYPTRTEIGIMEQHVEAMAEALGPEVLLVEYGSGSSWKTRILLDHLTDPAGYVPVDISKEHLMQAAGELSDDYPNLPVLPVCADYTDEVRLPDPGRSVRRRVVYFPGSTIGNFVMDRARDFLAHIRSLVAPDGGLLIGVDLQKDASLLHAAYDDAEGVTAEFNKNLLRRINRELDADFDLDRFEHEARYNAEEGRVEMHLVSTEAQQVTVAGVPIDFAEGETICTEYSCKYTLDGFADLAASAGLAVEQVWTDDDALFSIQYCTVAEAG